MRGQRQVASLTAQSSGHQQGRTRVGRRPVPKVLWDVVRAAAARAGVEKLAPHDHRRTRVRLCHLAGGELDQIQFVLAHLSNQTRSVTSDASSACGAQLTTASASRRALYIP